MLSQQSATLTESLPHICIVGVGLIGGSLAAALRAGGYTGRISGYDTRPLEPFVERGLLDDVDESFAQNQVCPADLIYLAAPISAIIEFLHTKGSLIKPGALVTDAGSTKRAIVAAATHLPAEITFIGGHPMAGSERTGAEFADPHLFNNTTYILTPTTAVAPDRMALLELLIAVLHARLVTVEPAEHDRMVALISQVPQLLATALAARVGSEAVSEILFSLAGNGYRDMTRLAASDWRVWGDICQTNADNIAQGLSQLATVLTNLQAALTQEQWATVADYFQQANEAAQQLRQTKVKLFSN